jgi:formamidopyrimidine-DNA glycosylase
MPELPEVESLRRSLESYIVGSTILHVQVLNGKLVSGKGGVRHVDTKKVAEFEKTLVGKKIKKLARRAKNIMIEFTTVDLLLVHLKMTGQLVFVSDDKKKIPFGGHPIEETTQKLPHKHTYIIFKLTNGTLYYNDVRQFGYCLYYQNVKDLENEKHFDKLGLEPFDKNFTVKYLEDKFAKLNSPLKKVLLEQKVVVGCGNIYCDEIAFASKILPTRLCSSLTKVEIKKLHKNILEILQKAIDSGGSSVANYLLADGSRGNYADYHKVYGKKGKPCPNCKTPLASLQLAGRTTVFCGVCQK